MDICVLQTCSVNHKKTNIQKILAHLKSISFKEKEMIFLPENSLFMRGSQAEKVDAFRLDDPELRELQEFCKEKKVFLHLGAIPVVEKEKIYNASVYIKPNGEMLCSYKKIHLFDVDVNEEKSIRESDAYTAGKDSSVFEYLGWSFGQSICYDLRFSNLYLIYAKQQVDAILVPSAFLYTTGKAHWETLLRARAIETQSYVIAAAQGGDHMGGQKTWGHSMVVSPWGEVLAEIKEVSEDVQSLRLSLDKTKIEEVRKQIPMYLHRKDI